MWGWPTAACGSSRTRSTCWSGGPSAPRKATKWSAATPIECRPGRPGVGRRRAIGVVERLGRTVGPGHRTEEVSRGSVPDASRRAAAHSPIFDPLHGARTMIRVPVCWHRAAARRIVALALWLGAGTMASAGPPVAGRLDYDFHIRPILADRCFACHGPDGKKRKADLRLDTPGGAVAAKVVVEGKP